MAERGVGLQGQLGLLAGNKFSTYFLDNILFEFTRSTARIVRVFDTLKINVRKILDFARIFLISWGKIFPQINPVTYSPYLPLAGQG